jgi:hypothetical protein
MNIPTCMWRQRLYGHTDFFAVTLKLLQLYVQCCHFFMKKLQLLP